MGTKFKKGSIVTCNDDHCYISYTQFVKRHPQYSARFAYKCFPYANKTYRIIGIYNHVMEDFWDDNDFVFVVESTQNRQLFLMGELGLTEVTSKKSKTINNEIKNKETIKNA